MNLLELRTAVLGLFSETSKVDFEAAGRSCGVSDMAKTDDEL